MVEHATRGLIEWDSAYPYSLFFPRKLNEKPCYLMKRQLIMTVLKRCNEISWNDMIGVISSNMKYMVQHQANEKLKRNIVKGVPMCQAHTWKVIDSQMKS